MAFHLHIEDADQAYIDGLPLSGAARSRVEDCIEYGICDVSDSFRNDPANRPYPSEATLFLVRFSFVDFQGDGRGHTIDFIVDDAGAAAGVLLLVYVEMDRPA